MRFLFLLWYCFVKHFNNIIQFLLKISLIWWDKFICNFKLFLLTKQVLLKTIVVIVDKLTKSKVLRDGAGGGGALRGPKGWGWGKKIFLVMWVGQEWVRQNHAGWEWSKTKPYGMGLKIPSFGPTPPHCHPYPCLLCLNSSRYIRLLIFEPFRVQPLKAMLNLH